MGEIRKPRREHLRERRHRHRKRHVAFRIAFAIAGIAVLLAGLAMLVLPGPGMLVTAIGLGMLALEFAWAEQLLGKALDRIERIQPQERSPLERFLIAAITIGGVIVLVSGIVLLIVLDLP